MTDPLSRRVLVLNRLWQAVNIVAVKRAFSLLMQEHAHVINTGNDFQVMNAAEWIAFSIENPPDHESEAVHTVRLSLRIPYVLLLSKYDRVPTKEMKFNRQNVFQRDGFVCQYCGNTFRDEDLNLDHVIPRDRGGQTSWENIVTSCIRCNTKKANQLPHQAGMHLFKKPHRPKWRTFVSEIGDQQLEPGWDYFLGKNNKV